MKTTLFVPALARPFTNFRRIWFDQSHSFPKRATAILAAVFAAVGLASANTELWIGVSGVSTTTNWSDNANWSNLTGGGGPGPNGNDVVFGDLGAAGASNVVNSVVDQNGLNPFSLTFTNNSFWIAGASSKYHTVLIPDGVLMTNANALTVGIQNSSSGNYFTWVGFTGGGAFVQNGTTMIVDNSSTTASAGTNVVLDLSGLSNFVATALTTLNIAGSGTESRGEGTLNLAQTSTITATNITLNTGSGNAASVGGTLNLGLTTNNINVTTFVVGQTKGSVSKVQFFGSTGGLRIRGVTGADSDRAVTLTLGDRNNTGSGTTSGSFLFNGHPVDIKATTMTVGQDRSGSGTSTHAGSGTVQFDTGTIDVTTINLAVSTSAGTSSSANGAITVGGAGTLVVGAGGISLGNKSGGSTGATGTLTISGGTVNCSGNITKANTGAVGNITLTGGGTLKMAAGTTVGTTAIPIDTLTLQDGTSLHLGLVGNGSATATNIVATTVAASGTTTITIDSIGGVTSPTTFPLIKYSGADPFANLSLAPLPTGYTGGGLVDNTAKQTIEVTINPPPTLVWVGALSDGTLDGTWNTSDLNWLSGATYVAYADPDSAQFDDSASNNIVTLAAAVSPGSITVNNNVLDYTFTGAGGIGGGATLTKNGSGTLTIANTGANSFGNIALNAGTLAFNRSDSFTTAGVISGGGSLAHTGSGTNALTAVNTYTGATLISSGEIVANNASGGNSSLGNFAGSVTITNGGTLDVENATANSFSFTNTSDSGGKQFFIAGAGVGGSGAIVNNGTVNQQNAFQRITLTGDATVGGPARWDMRVPDGKFAPILDLNGFTLTKTGPNQMSMVALVVTNSGDIVINSGILSFETTSTFTNGTGTITVNPGGVLGHFRENAGYFTRPIILNGGMIRDLNGTPGSTNDSPIMLTADSFLDLNVGSTDLLQLNGVIDDAGGGYGLTKTNIGSYALSAASTYHGDTRIVQGRLALVGNGSIANSANIIVSGGATFDASGRSDGALTLGFGQTLKGNGTVIGTTVVGSGATVAPGASVGQLTDSGSVLLQGGGTLAVEVQNATSGAGIGNDSLAVSGNIGVLATSGNPFTIKLLSLDGTGAPGAVTNFDNTTNYTWTIATGTVTNFNASAFVVDTSGFANALGGGQFFVSSTGNSLVVLFKTAGSVGGVGGSISNPAVDGSGHPTFSGHGIPGYTYGVESAPSVSGPWSEAGTVTADVNGSWSFTDVSQTNPGTIFYRLYYPDNPGNPPQ